MRGHVAAFFGVALLLPVFTMFGGTITQVNQIVAFGDSLTDTGNASIATLGAEPGAGYYYRTIPLVPFQVGEFTNPPATGGPSGVWINQFAASAGLPNPQPSLPPVGGTNYAVGGATTGSNGIDGVSDQVGFYLNGRTSIPSTSLYSFWAGANDIIAGNNPVQAANNLEANIATLAAAGGKYFLWFNLPLLGDTPAGVASGQAAALNTASIAFDTQWAADIQTLDKDYSGITLVGVDINALFQQILTTPGNDGFNVTTPGIDVPGADPNNYLFWDPLHPTSAADAFIADTALTDFDAAVTPASGVPEPSSAALALFGLGLALIIASSVKLKNRS
ncbi:MAG TPA: SGNH/GDSL hydrolase family protein [Bryobacteraceae bacterium]|nr:SGNH/GDSL hydrolase family protein [Bryobacteraceae bacterium]